MNQSNGRKLPKDAAEADNTKGGSGSNDVLSPGSDLSEQGDDGDEQNHLTQPNDSGDIHGVPGDVGAIATSPRRLDGQDAPDTLDGAAISSGSGSVDRGRGKRAPTEDDIIPVEAGDKSAALSETAGKTDPEVEVFSVVEPLPPRHEDLLPAPEVEVCSVVEPLPPGHMGVLPAEEGEKKISNEQEQGAAAATSSGQAGQGGIIVSAPHDIQQEPSLPPGVAGSAGRVEPSPSEPQPSASLASPGAYAVPGPGASTGSPSRRDDDTSATPIISATRVDTERDLEVVYGTPLETQENVRPGKNSRLMPYALVLALAVIGALSIILGVVLGSNNTNQVPELTGVPTNFPSTFIPTSTSSPTSTPSPTIISQTPTAAPTISPTYHPTVTPTSSPTYHPTVTPTSSPVIPTSSPTFPPTITPPTASPTTTLSPVKPTISPRPTMDPSHPPSASPVPSLAPTTLSPTLSPTATREKHRVPYARMTIVGLGALPSPEAFDYWQNTTSQHIINWWADDPFILFGDGDRLVLDWKVLVTRVVTMNTTQNFTVEPPDDDPIGGGGTRRQRQRWRQRGLASRHQQPEGGHKGQQQRPRLPTWWGWGEGHLNNGKNSSWTRVWGAGRGSGSVNSTRKGRGKRASAKTRGNRTGQSFTDSPLQLLLHSWRGRIGRFLQVFDPEEFANQLTYSQTIYYYFPDDVDAEEISRVNPDVFATLPFEMESSRADYLNMLKENDPTPNGVFQNVEESTRVQVSDEPFTEMPTDMPTMAPTYNRPNYGLSSGAIAGIVIGSLSFVAIFGVWYVYRPINLEDLEEDSDYDAGNDSGY